MKKTLTSMVGAIALLFAAVIYPVAAFAQQGLPVKQVWAEQYNNWSFASQAPNTYTFAGINCNSFPLTEGLTPSYFVFGNPQSSVAYPVFIQDANASNSEIVTPSSLSTTSSACGFSASTANSHTSFIVKSGTAGLQDAVGSLANSGAQAINVLLDRTWYGLIAALPGAPSANSIISNLKAGSVGVQVVDTTTSPWTYYNWTGTQYANNGGSALPGVVLGAGAGTSPTGLTVTGSGSNFTVTFKSGTSPTASAILFTATSPTAANGGFNHTPACTAAGVYNSGTLSYGGANPETIILTASASALTASTVYTFFLSCH